MPSLSWLAVVDDSVPGATDIATEVTVPSSPKAIS